MSKSHIPWVDKYRPYELKDIILPKDLDDCFTMILETNVLNHMIISGDPGIGKTTTARCLLSELYGKYYDDCVMELNASDERYTKIQSDLVTFAKLMMPYKSDKYPAFKTIILDEADHVPELTQSMINQLMQGYGNRLKFIFTCNSLEDVIEAIKSRCKIIGYQKIPISKIMTRLKYICQKENIDYDDDALELIAKYSDGDMRETINSLGKVANRHNYINIDNVNDMIDKPNINILRNILELCSNGDKIKAIKKIKDVEDKGFSCKEIVTAMINVLESQIDDKNLKIPEGTKINYYRILIRKLIDISNYMGSSLQLLSIIVLLCENKVRISSDNVFIEV